MMKRLTVALCGYLLIAAAAMAQTTGTWRQETHSSAPGWINVQAQVGQTGFVYLSCSRQSVAMSIAVTINARGMIDPHTETMFLRLGEFDYLLPWSPVDGDDPAAYQIAWIPTAPWPQQTTFLETLLAGKPLQVMASRQTDRKDARVLMTVTTAPGDPSIVALNQSCAAASQQSPMRSDWSVLERTNHWNGRTAVSAAKGTNATIMAVCDATGRPFLAARVDGYPDPQGQIALPAEIDGHPYQLIWSGWQGLAVTSPPPGFIDAMKSGRQVIFHTDRSQAIAFSLAGAGSALDQALAGCSTSSATDQAAGQPGATDMLARLKKSVRDRVAAECISIGGTGANVPDNAFQEVYRQEGAFPDVWFYYSEANCIGGPGVGAGRCGASNCVEQRYLPGETDYFLSDEVLR